MASILVHIQQFPIGFTEALYNGKKYGVTRSDFNGGKSIKLYAEEQGGTDFISLNYYITTTNEILKPCEMPEEKVIHFLRHCHL
jgi:hypothetical protein